MDENLNTNEDIAPEPEIGSGALLSKERKKANKSVEDIAEELNLSVSQIRSIERDHSEGLPEPTYVRGYIRSYAKLLGLDPEEVLTHYQNRNWQKSMNLDDIPKGITDSDDRESSSIPYKKILALLIVIGVSAYLWYIFDQNADFKTNQSSGVIVVPTESDDEEESESSDLLNQNTDSLLEVNEGDTDVGQLESESAVNGLTQEADQIAGAEENKIVMVFNETSWVDVRDQQQQKLAYQSYPAGDRLEISSLDSLNILLGNAKGVEMTLNGTPYDLTQHTQGVYAKFQIDAPQSP